MVTTCSKEYTDFPFAHREPNHSGYGRYIHGHSLTFRFTFVASEDSIDPRSLKWIKEWLNQKFDHTTVLNADDPLRVYFESNSVDKPATSGSLGVYDLRWVPDCSCPGLAAYVFTQINSRLIQKTDGRVKLASLTVTEDSTTYATVGQ